MQDQYMKSGYKSVSLALRKLMLDCKGDWEMPGTVQLWDRGIKLFHEW